MEAELSNREFSRIRSLLNQWTGIDLGEGKKALVQSRLAKRMRHYRLKRYRDYLQLFDDPATCAAEKTPFINCLTTNKTEFFRESHHFDFLRETILPQLLNEGESEKKIRIWSAASSTGEEPYSLAMTLREFMEEAPDWDCRILASDIDTNVLKTATDGKYPKQAIDRIPRDLARKYFHKQKDGNFVAHQSLKSLLAFRQINLFDEALPIKAAFQVIFCRNVLIYFNKPTQEKIVNSLLKFLIPGGYLIIGHSESLLNYNHRLEFLGNTIYRLAKEGEKTRSHAPRRERETGVASNVSTQEVPSDSTPKTLVRPRSAKSAVSIVGRNIIKDTNPLRATERIVSEGNLASDEALQVFPIILGEYYIASTPCRIQTNLGSCVATCLFDPVAKLGGMNHFMLPDGVQDPLRKAVFGVHAMEMLINGMVARGARKDRLRAKVFGGACLLKRFHSGQNVGEQNIDFIRKFLARENIPVDAEWLGGDVGLHVSFFPTVGRVRVRKIAKSAEIPDELQHEATSTEHSENRRWNDAVEDATLFDAPSAETGGNP